MCSYFLPERHGVSCALLGAALGFSARLAAQDFVLERYYVTAGPPPGGLPAGVSHAQLGTHLPVDVGALLGREVSSITSVRRGGVASDLLLRGLGRDNVTVTIDGAAAHAACPGRMDPPVFHVSTPLLERIVVYEGPFDVRYGAAPGGSVAVKTAEAPGTREANVGLLGGSDQLFSGDIAAGGPFAPRWRGLLGGSYQQGRCYRDGDGVRPTEMAGANYRPEFRGSRAFRIAYGEAQAAWQGPGTGVLTLRAAANDANDVFYPALLMDARRDRATRLGVEWKAKASLRLADRWRIEAHHHRVTHDMSDAFRISSLGAWSTRGYMMRTIAATTSYGIVGEAEVSRPSGDIAYGAQLTRRNWVADNVIGYNANPMLPDATTTQAGLFVQAERSRTAWKVKAGARLDGWRTRAARDIGFVQRAHGTRRNLRSDLAATGFVLAERTWRDLTALFAGVGRGARVPDAQERYIVVDRPAGGTDWVGNPDLDLVRATEVTAGTRFHVGAMRVSVRAFHSWLEDFIVLGHFVPAAGATANPSRTESYFGIDAVLSGGEATAELRLNDQWSATWSTAAQFGHKRSRPPGDVDRDLPEIPPWHARVTLEWRKAATSIGTEVSWAARQTHLDATVGERPVPGYVAWHVRAAREFGAHVTFSLGVENVFDRTYASHNAYTRDPFAAGLIINEPGRFVYASMRWRR